MHNIFYKTRNSFFLSNNIRKYFYLCVIIVFLITMRLQSQNAYINDFRVNDDVTTKSQFNSRLGVDSSGNFVVAWNDMRNSSANNSTQVYCQIIDKNGNRVGNNFRIGQDTTWLDGLTVLKNGKFIIFWRRYFNTTSAELYFQRFDRNGIPLNAPTKVIDTVYFSTVLNTGDIESDRNGNFTIIWQARPYGTLNAILHAQRFDSVGNKIGIPIIVNDTIGFFAITDTKIAMDEIGNFMVSWSDRRFNVSQQKYDIFFQRFNSNGVKIGNNIKVNDDNDSTKAQILPWIGGNGNGNFVITWTDRRNFFNDFTIFYQIYDSTGTPIGSNKRADESLGTPAYSKVAMKKDSRFFIGWGDNWYAGRLQYYGRRYTKTGDTIGNIYMIPQISPPSSFQIPNDIKILGDRIYTTWEDTRNANTDVYCNVRSFQNPDTLIIGITPISNIIPKGYKLYPAYPNPFNPVTKIKYDLPKNEDVFIYIYDITGKTIKNIYFEKQNKGIYEITITNEKLSSGVYFFKILTESGFNAVQKLILIK